MIEHNIWAEKYRPKTLDECILSPRILNAMKQYVTDGAPSLLLTGSSGLGKTTTVLAFLHDIGAEYIKLNGSLSRNIDTLRSEIAEFVTTMSLDGKKKYVFFDEIDNLNAESTQLALRGFMDEYAHVVSFIGTCNYPGRLIEGMLSRMIPIDFTIDTNEKKDIAKQYHTRMLSILDKESIQYKSAIIAKLIMQKFPDFRVIIGACQHYAKGHNNQIDEGILISDASKRIGEVIELMKTKNYKDLRMWIAENPSIGYQSMYRAFYDNAYQYIKPSSVPAVVLIIAKYLDMHTRSVDQEITFTAGLTEIMMQVQWND